ncbi:putative transporter [Rothia kristinae]|nr:putative transporter [Rothia kristinae]SQC37962.1 putative transporter [Rothia kristinae]
MTVRRRQRNTVVIRTQYREATHFIQTQETHVNVAVIILYLLLMLFLGWVGKRRARSTEDYRVAGRRLGPVFYTGTMSAVVLGGAATIGGVGLGWTYGLSGVWLVTAIAVGVIVLSLLFAGRLQRLRVYTVSQMLGLRFGGRAVRASSIVILGYTLMLAVTSTSAYASVFGVLFGIDRA